MYTARTRAIPARIRRAVISRDGMACTYCGQEVVRTIEPVPHQLHLDHVKPWADGGVHTIANLVVSCRRCNLSRPRPKADLNKVPLYVGNAQRGYFWREDFTPPLLADEEKVLFPIEFMVRRPRYPLEKVISMAANGRLAVTPSGRIYVEVPEGWFGGGIPKNRRHRMAAGWL